MIGTQLCCVVHDKNDLTKDDLLNASLFIHGKEPEPKVVQIGPRFFVTPGKLTGAAEQTCGLLELVDKSDPLQRVAARRAPVLPAQVLSAGAAKTKLSVK